MKFKQVIKQLLKRSPEGLSPQEIRDLIKQDYPEFYGTESHINNVEKGHYNDLDHALLAQIYVVQRNANDIYSDRSQRPMKLILLKESIDADIEAEESISSENLQKLEDGIGTLYILGTNLFTEEGKEIVKIGITTGPVEKRIDQLYTTSVPYRFQVLQQFETRNYSELEQAMHKIFDPFRINRSREFFTDECLQFIDALLKIHKQIQDKSRQENKI